MALIAHDEAAHGLQSLERRRGAGFHTAQEDGFERGGADEYGASSARLQVAQYIDIAPVHRVLDAEGNAIGQPGYAARHLTGDRLYALFNS